MLRPLTVSLSAHRLDLGRDLTIQTCVEFGRLLRHRSGDWGNFLPLSQGIVCDQSSLLSTLKVWGLPM